MIVTRIEQCTKADWDAQVDFPTQSYAWYEACQRNGMHVERIGFFDDAGVRVAVAILIVHSIFRTSLKRAYIQRSALFTEEMYEALRVYGKNRFVSITIEPHVFVGEGTVPPILRHSPFEFVRFTPCIDLTLPYVEIEKKFSKTVRNENRLAEKNGIHVAHGATAELFADFLKIIDTTISRKNFHGHTSGYYTTVFDTLKQYDQVECFVVYADSTPVAAACVFVFKDALYYVYAGSLGSQTPRGAMYHLVISIILWGQETHKQTLDLFGSLSPDNTDKHPWQGFTQFKKSFGPEFKQYIGTYELVIHPFLYTVLVFAYKCKKLLARKK